MKLDTDYFKITEVPDSLVTNILSIIEEKDWYENDFRKTIGPALQTCNSIPIVHNTNCANKAMDNSAIRDLKKFPAYDKFYPVLKPVLDILRNYYDFRQYAAFIARLAPKSKIEMHYENWNFLSKCHRIHLPLVTNPLVQYIIEDNSYYWKRGNLYEFDNMRKHGVINNSDEYRIHLVINLYNLTDSELNS